MQINGVSCSTSVLAFAIAGMIALLMTVLTGSFQAMKAALINTVSKFENGMINLKN